MKFVNTQNEVPVLGVHDAVSLGKCFPTFRDNVVVLSAGFEVPKNVGVQVDVGASANGGRLDSSRSPVDFPCILHYCICVAVQVNTSPTYPS
jgi:hypothetical protein